MQSTNYGLQVRLGNGQWVTYCGIWRVSSLLEATDKASRFDAVRDNRTGGLYSGYRAANLVTGATAPIHY